MPCQDGLCMLQCLSASLLSVYLAMFLAFSWQGRRMPDSMLLSLPHRLHITLSLERRAEELHNTRESKNSPNFECFNRLLAGATSRQCSAACISQSELSFLWLPGHPYKYWMLMIVSSRIYVDCLFIYITNKSFIQNQDQWHSQKCSQKQYVPHQQMGHILKIGRTMFSG